MKNKRFYEDEEDDDEYIHPDGPLPPQGPEPSFPNNLDIYNKKTELKRTDVEKILEKSYDFYRENLKDGINLVDIYALADQIWREIVSENNAEEETFEFVLTKSQILSLEKWGDLGLATDDDKQIYIEFLDDTLTNIVTESGKILIDDIGGKKLW